VTQNFPLSGHGMASLIDWKTSQFVTHSRCPFWVAWYTLDMGKRVAIYLRVSGEGQTTANQQPECQQLAEQRGSVVATYEEQGSAVKVRPEFARMMKDAKRGKFDVLVIWALDRFGRSMPGNMADLEELDRLGVQVVSVRESWLDTSGPWRSSRG